MSEITRALDDAVEKTGQGLAKDFADAYHGILKDTEGKAKQAARNAAENEEATARDLAQSAEKDAGATHVGDPARPGSAGGHEPGTSSGPPGSERPGHDGEPSFGAAESQPGQPSEGNGGCTTGGDPVDVVSGQMITSATDAELAALLPLVLRRAYASGYVGGHLFGPGWSSTLDQRIHIDADGIRYAGDDAQILHYSLPADTSPRVRPQRGARWPLEWDGPEGSVRIHDPATGWIRHFDPVPGRPEAKERPLATLTDRNGHRIDHLYDRDGLPVEIRHSGGYRIAVDTAQTVDGPRVCGLRLLDGTHEGRGTTLAAFEFDQRGRLAAVLNSSGLRLTYTWDEHDRITGWTDRNGHWYAYAYGPDGRVASGRGSDGALDADFVYDLERRTTVVTNSLGQATSYAYDQYGHLTAVTDPLGAVVRTDHDADGRLLSRTDELGHTTRYSYDGAGNLLRVQHPDGTVRTADYNALGLPIRITGPDGAVWQQDFDERGNRTSVTDPAGAVTRFTYDAQGRPTAVTDPLNCSTRIVCNPAGLPIESTDPLGQTARTRRDAFGRVATLSDALGRTTRLSWNVEGLLTERTDPDGATERWAYDAEGNLVAHTDPLGGRTVLAYGPFSQLIARTGPDGARYVFTHDTELRLTQVVNPLGVTWNYGYDAAGRMTVESDFNGATLRYTHDATGRPLSRTNAAGQRVGYTYDPLGRLIAKQTENGTTAFTYDPSGRLLEATGPEAHLVRRYDRAGLLAEESVDGRTTSYVHDAVAHRIRRRTPSGAETAWTYDDAGNLTELTAGGHPIAFERDPAGRETMRRLGPDLTLFTTWDAADRIVSQDLTDGSAASPHLPSPSAILHRDYAYRSDGNLLAVTSSDTGARRFDLDPAGRVTAVHGQGWHETYAYDPLGNLSRADWPTWREGGTVGDRTHSGTLVTAAGRTTYRHDDAGRTTARSTTTLSGRTDTWHYTWDAEDRLTQAITPDGTHWRYSYDPLGRRTAKCRLAPDGTVVERTDFTWDGTHLAEQTATGPNLPGPYTLTWDHLGQQPVAQSEQLVLEGGDQGEVDRRFFAIITDLVGAPTHLLSDDGTIAWRSRSSLWGDTTPAAGSLTSIPLRYPGQYFDPETRLHYNHHRYYDPTTARYLTPDPLGLEPAPNPHTYVLNPLTWADPLGLSAFTPLGITNSNFWTLVDYQGQRIYQRDDLIRPSYVSPEDNYGRTNLKRMQQGLAPMGPDDRPLNLHHMLQTQDGPIAELTQSMHLAQGDYAGSGSYNTLHWKAGTKIPSGIDRDAFTDWKKQYWKDRAKALSSGGCTP